ncbi:MAG: nitrogen fixation protein NifX [Nitrospirae bacterium]|nr:nitrogen fixation protein NifX [Nitrospirota bacterium]
MKVAFATTDGINIDEHFGRAGSFAIFDLSRTGYQFTELRKFADGIDQAVVGTREQGAVHDEVVQDKVDRLADCKIVFMTEIGGPSAARLVKKGIMPMKVKAVTAIEDSIKQLHETIMKTPPPWLKKALTGSAER